jgi:ABC-type glycerol-3-phosphate transport system substrate-binding protein
MAGAVLAACGGAPTPTPTAAPSKPAAAATPAKATVSGDLQIWAYTNVENDLDMVYKPMMVKFNQQFPNIKWNVDVQPWGGRREKLYAAVAAGQAPDVWNSTTDTLLTYVDKKIIAPLDDVLTKDLLKSWGFFQDAIDAGSLDGKYYITVNFQNILGYGYNTKLMKDCGYDPAAATMTWDDLLALGEKAKAKTLYLEDLSLIDWSEWVVTVHQAGGTVYNTDRATTNMTKQPAVDALNRWVKEYKNGYVALEFAIASDTASATLPKYFLEGKTLIQPHFENTQCQTILTTNPSFPVMGGAPRQRTKNDAPISGLSSGNGWSMTSASKYKQAAGEWIKWMQTPENLAEWANLSIKTPPSEKAQALWKPASCVKDFTDRNAKYQFAGVDTQLLWQESKAICAPHFQAAVLGKIPAEQALANCDKELTAKLQSTYGAKS